MLYYHIKGFGKMFCMECGSKVPDGAKFCPDCGYKFIHETTQEKIKHTENVRRCPACSAVIGTIDAVCSSCGCQITNVEVSSSVKQFAIELAKIEASDNPKSGLAVNCMSILGIDKVVDHSFGTKKFERKISLIQSFPIPNTVGEIAEFVIMASTNIDVKFGKNTIANKMYGRPGSTYYTDVKLANAWISKLQQAYQKALISFSNQPEFEKLEKIYLDKMAELNIKTR